MFISAIVAFDIHVCHQAFINVTNILMHHHFMSSQYNSCEDEATVDFI